MVLSVGDKKIKTAVFISGKGSNLKNLIKFSKKVKSPISINLIISDNLSSKGLNYAKAYKIQKKTFLFKKKIQAETKILKLLKKKKYTFYLSSRFYENFVKKFYKKV